MNRKGIRPKVTKRDSIKRSDRIKHLISLRSKGKKKTAKALLKV